MNVDIDMAADAVAVTWGPRDQAASQMVRRPGRRGVRLFYDESGDVVGVEVLGWSQRADRPTSVEVTVHPPDSGEHLSEADPLGRALLHGSTEMDENDRPLHEGRPMMTLSEASATIGRERSWISREMASGRLRATKIGRTWWTARDWVETYLTRRQSERTRRQV